MRDLLAGLALSAFSVVMFWRASLIRNPGFDLLGPAFTAKLVLGVLLLLSLGLALSGVLELRRAKGPRGAASRPDLGRQVGLVTILFVYIALLISGWAGFEIASLAFILATGVLLMDWSLLRGAILASTAAVVVFGSSYLFRNVLFVNLP